MKRFLLLMTTLIITASILTGCGSPSSETEETKETQAAAKELDISTSTGDSLTIICQNTGEDTISFNKEVSAITYFNDDESAKAQALLLTEDLYKQYADSLKKSGTLIGPYDDNGVKTSLYSCKISGDDYYVYSTYSVGVFEITPGEEIIFPVTGQHQVEGIKKAIIENPDLANEKVPVILIGHQNTSEGKQRTRRLFLTLNRRSF